MKKFILLIILLIIPETSLSREAVKTTKNFDLEAKYSSKIRGDIGIRKISSFDKMTLDGFFEGANAAGDIINIHISSKEAISGAEISLPNSVYSKTKVFISLGLNGDIYRPVKGRINLLVLAKNKIRITYDLDLAPVARIDGDFVPDLDQTVRVKGELLSDFFLSCTLDKTIVFDSKATSKPAKDMSSKPLPAWCESVIRP